jgi:hypothetical protein
MPRYEYVAHENFGPQSLVSHLLLLCSATFVSPNSRAFSASSTFMGSRESHQDLTKMVCPPTAFNVPQIVRIVSQYLTLLVSNALQPTTMSTSFEESLPWRLESSARGSRGPEPANRLRRSTNPTSTPCHRCLLAI